MILEGFEIEHWSCLQRVVVDDLPPQGVVVVHGPNGTGKSSIVAALRACLLDYASSSGAQDLKRWFPKNGGPKPRVSVRFRAQGGSWRITKLFGSKDSKLESLSAAGAWRLEANTAAEAHERTQQLVGGISSEAGLHQLLWLTQAEFQLPAAKNFDKDVQSQLRGVLGVLQTPLDDRFLQHVRETRSRWFGARSGPGDRPKLKKDCSLSKALTQLELARGELARIEAEFAGYERLLKDTERLEIAARDLRHQRDAQQRAVEQIQAERQDCQLRLSAHTLALEHLATAEKARSAALELRELRDTAERKIAEADQLTEKARDEGEHAQRLLAAAESRLRAARTTARNVEQAGRELQVQSNAVARNRESLSRQAQARAVNESLRRAEEIAVELDQLKAQERVRSAPDVATIVAIEANRTAATKLQSEIQAAAITVALHPDSDDSTARATIDGQPAKQVLRPGDAVPMELAISRHAELAIPGWGRVEIRRGEDFRSLGQIESELAGLDRDYCEAIAPFGFNVESPSVLEQLRTLSAERQVRAPILKRLTGELKRLAPKGIDALREEAAESAKLAVADGTLEANDSPAELEQRASQLENLMAENRTGSAAAQQAISELEAAIDGSSERALPQDGLRQRESAANTLFTSLKVKSELLRQDLDRLQTAEQIARAIDKAEFAYRVAADEVAQMQLTESERTVGDRLEAALTACKALNQELERTHEKLNVVKGALTQSEGLHQHRAAAAAKVEELQIETEREELESLAYDRLFVLFEECRQKQLGTVMGPIHDRVVRWMRLLGIGNYQSIRFNDEFLPEALISGDDMLSFNQESTGTVEQLGLMVRLALGATLSKPGESAVAILDDPLTHSDVGRLNLMRAILRSAAAGEPDSTPPAGPLQILIFTCHPEWFRVDDQPAIDLGNNAILTRAV